MFTKAWRVYGADGHRQRESFNKSYTFDFSNDKDGVRIISVYNSDITGTNEYSVIIITRNTADECDTEFFGQLSDGVFENSRTGRTAEIIFWTAAKETGDIIESFPTYEEAKKAMKASQKECSPLL